VKEREALRREHAAFRLVRKLSADDPRRMAGWLFGLSGEESPRVNRLVSYFRLYDPIDPGNRPIVTH